MIRVVVVDDQDLVRAGLAALLDRADDITADHARAQPLPQGALDEVELDR